MNKCHFTIIMSCVQSILRNIRQIFGQIRLSQKFGLPMTFAFGHTLFFIAWIKFDFFIIFWLRHVFIMTFVIIRYTQKIFQILCRLKLKAQELLTNVSAIVPKVRPQMATSVCFSNFTLIKCRIKLEAQEILQTCQLYRPRSPTSNSNERVFLRPTSNWSSNVD